MTNGIVAIHSGFKIDWVCIKYNFTKINRAINYDHQFFFEEKNPKSLLFWVPLIFYCFCFKFYSYHLTGLSPISYIVFLTSPISGFAKPRLQLMYFREEKLVEQVHDLYHLLYIQKGQLRFIYASKPQIYSCQWLSLSWDPYLNILDLWCIFLGKTPCISFQSILWWFVCEDQDLKLKY